MALPIRFATLKTQLCDCGQVIIITQSENISMFSMLQANSDISLIGLDNSAANCPNCGKTYFLPPAEMFDIERAPWGKLAEELNNLGCTFDTGRHPGPGDDEDIRF